MLWRSKDSAMSSQFLQTELSNLIQESKRKNSDLRNVHPSIQISQKKRKNIPCNWLTYINPPGCRTILEWIEGVTFYFRISNISWCVIFFLFLLVIRLWLVTEWPRDLVRKKTFVDPFVIACHGRYGKLAAIGVVCIQRLIASRSLPPERLKDVLDGLWETTNLSWWYSFLYFFPPPYFFDHDANFYPGQDVQLKILQSLPSLMQYYFDYIRGDLLSSTLELCATLQASKNAAVSGTAAATLQQLVVTTFERVFVEDSKCQHWRSLVSPCHCWLTNSRSTWRSQIDDNCRSRW